MLRASYLICVFNVHLFAKRIHGEAPTTTATTKKS